LEVDTLSVTVSNLAIDLATGSLSGVTDSGGTHPPVLTITAASATMFPGGSTITGSISATAGGDGLGFQGTFNLQTGAFSITLEELHLAIGSVFTADASGVLVTYDPADSDPHQQLVQIGTGLLDFKFGQSDITGSLTNLTIYKDGFHFDSVTIAYVGTINLGSILTITDPSVTLTDFGLTFGSGNVTFTTSGSLTLSAATATLNVSAFSASASDLSIIVVLDPADLGHLTITAGTLTLKLATVVNIQATNISIDTAPADGGAYLTVGTATATLKVSNLITLTGSASNFSLINDGGTPKLHEDAGFALAITATPGQLKLPDWLGFQIQKFEIKWTNFADHPEQFILVLSASIDSIQGLPGGVTVSGSITDAVIDFGKLEAGLFPITSVGSVGGSVSGTLFGMEVNASFVLGVVNFNAANQIVSADGSVIKLTTSSNGTVTETVIAGGDATVVDSVMYVGVAGGATIPGVGGVQIYIGFSSLGPLTVYLSAEFPLILDPQTGIAIGGFSGGVMFNYTLPVPGQATDLRTISLSPAGVSISQWQIQLRDQTVSQYTASSGGTNLTAAYSQPFVIVAGITLYDAYLTSNSFKITGQMAIQIDPGNLGNTKIYVTGTATFGNSVSFNAYLYANIQVSGATSTATFMFLVDAPATTPVESFGGTLTFGFTDSNGVPLTTPPTATVTQVTGTTATGSTYTSTQFTAPTIGGFYLGIDGFAQFSAFGALSVTVKGSVTLTVTGTFAKIDLSGTLNISALGDLATATGQLVVDYAGGLGSLQIYGALKLETGSGFAKLEGVGLYVDGAATFILNTTNSIHTVYLADPANPHDSTLATAYNITDKRVFEVMVTGTAPGTFASLEYKVSGNTVLSMKGAFDLKIDSTGLTMFANIDTLTVGTGSTAFLTLSGFGLFVINANGFAAEMNLSLKSQAIEGVTLTASFALVLNTTSTDVLYTIPDGLPLLTIPGSSTPVSSLTIPRGPPLGLQQADGSFASTGATGPYIVITGQGHLDLYGIGLDGFFYFQFSNSAAGPVVALVVSVTGDLGFGTVTVTGGFQLSSAGVVALLEASGSAGGTTSYGTGISLQVTAELAFNSTAINQDNIGGIPLKATDGTPLTITAHSAKVVASGTMSLNFGGGTGFYIRGVFSTEVVNTTTSGGAVETTTITVNGTLTATVGGSTLLTLTASGVMVYTSGAGATNPGMVAGLKLTAGSSNPLSGNGFTFNGEFDLQVNTTGVTHTVVLDAATTPATTLTITGGVNGQSTGGPYVEVHAFGAMIFGTATNGFQLNNGDFYLSAGGGGLAVSASATMALVVGGTSLVSVSASGGMLISPDGFAAILTVTATLNDPNGHFGFGGTFSLQVNTTGVDQQIGAVTVSGSPGTAGAPAGPYFQVYISGTLALGSTNTSASTGMLMTGDFYLTISSGGMAVSATTTMYLKVAGANIFTFHANGALLITGSGIAAKITLGITAGSSNTGFSFGATVNFTLSLNTTGTAIATINNVAVNLPGGGFYFQVVASGGLKLGGFVNVSGSFTLTIGNDADGHSAVVIHFNASATIFGVVFGLTGDAGIYSNGIAIKMTLSIGGNGLNPTANVIPGVLAVSGVFTLELNLTGQAHFGIAGTTAFKLSITNFTVYVFGFAMVGGGGHPSFLEFLLQTDGSFYCSGSLSFNFFGFGSVDVTFDFDSHGNFTFVGSLYVQLGSDGFNIHGTLAVRFSNEAPPNFELSVDGGVTAFHHTFASVGADVQINGTSVDISAYVSVDLGLFSIGGTVHIHLGSLATVPTPPPPAVGVVSTGSITVGGQTFGAGTLLLNLGDYADAARGVGAQADENYTITYVGAGTTAGTIKVDVYAPGVYSQPIEYDNVRRIVVPNADTSTGTSNVTVQIDNTVFVPVVVFAGTGTNQFFMGGGQATIYGTSGNDTVVGGPGGVIFHAGSGTSLFVGGNGNNTIYDPGTVRIVEGYTTTGYDSTTKTIYPVPLYYTYYSLSGSVLTYGNGVINYTDTLVGTFAMVTLTAPTSGATTFQVSNYSGNVTLNANGNANVTTSITLDNGNLSLTGNVVTQSNGATGAITLQGINTVSLFGGAGNNTFTVNSWSGTGAVTLDGKAGDDAYIINFKSSGSFTANVHDTGASGMDVMTVNGTTGADTLNLSTSAVVLGAQTVNYSGLENLVVYTKAGNDTVNITGTSAITVINAGGGNDTFNVLAINDATTLNLGTGTNRVNVGTLAPTVTGGTLNNIRALLTVTGASSGANTLYLDDSADNSAATATLTDSSLTGVFGSGGSLGYSNIATFNLYLGNGSHTMNVQGMNGTVNITLGNGANTINLGSNAGAIVTDPVTGNGANTGSVLDKLVGILNFTGTGANTVNVDDSGSSKPLTAALKPTSLQFLNLVTVNLPTVVAINLSLSQGNDLFAVQDTFTSASITPVIVLDGNGGDDIFVILDTHAVMTVNGGDGGDSFYNLGNSSVLNLNGNAGDDSFYIYASVVENTSNVNAGSASAAGNKIYSYRQNAAVNIDGGTGNDKLFIFGTVLNDTIYINGTHITGAGVNVTFTNIEQLTIAGLGGDDTFYIQSIVIPTLLIGDGSIVPVPSLAALGITLPDLTGGVTPTSFNDTFYIGWQGAGYLPGSLAGILAPLSIQGDNGPNLDGTTTNLAGTTDTIYVDDSADTASRTFLLTATTLTSSAMGVNGLINYDLAVEDLNIQAGAGADSFTINGTGVGEQTSIYGGRGNDAFIVNDTNGGALASPLALFGEANTFAGDTLTVNGAGDGNTFDVTGFTIDGAGATISYETMEKLTINAGGATTFNVNGDSVPTFLNGSASADTFNINSNVVALTLAGNAGDDVFVINANSGALTATGDAGNDSFTVNANSGTLTLSGGADNDSFVINGNSGALTANGDAGADTFTVNALSAAATLNGGAGNDSFTANAPLAAALTVNGGGDIGDLLTVNGTGGNDYLVITGNTVNGAGATITYTATNNLVVNGVAGDDTFLILSDSVNTTVNGSNGNDLFYIRTTNGLTTINTGGGINTVDIGSNVPYPNSSVLDGIQGAVTVNGNTHDTLNIDDTASTAGKTGTLTASTLNGLGMGAGGITYGGIVSLNLWLGSGSDTLNIRSTNLGTQTLVNTGAGANIINVGSLAPLGGGIVDYIKGPLTLVGSGSDTLNVDDTGSLGGKTGTLTPTSLTGLGLGVSGIVYSGLAGLNIALGQGGDTFLIVNTPAAVTRLNGNGGNDTFNILATTGTLYLNGGNGSNTFNLGSAAPGSGGTLNNLAGAILIIGETNSSRLIGFGLSGTSTVNLDDSGDSTSNTGTLTSSTLTGLGLTAGVTFVAVDVMNIKLGAGSDTFNVQSTSLTTVTTLNTGAGTNVINVGSLAPLTGGVINGIQGALIVVGSGSDTLNVDDTGSTLAKTGLLTATTLTGLGMGTAGITYSGLSGLKVNLGSGNDTFNIQSTNSLTVTTLNTGAGTNVINVGSLTPLTGGVVSGIQGALIVVGSGSDTLNVDDTGSTLAKTGLLTATTLTGLGMGAAGITYAGLSVLQVNLGSGNDTFNIQSTNLTTVTTLNTGAGTNVINVGSLAPLVGGMVNGIQGALILVGSGSDTLNVNNTGNTVSQSGLLTATTLTGLGMGAAGITYSGLSLLQVNLGSGNDTFTVTGVTNSTVTIIDGGPGANNAILNFSGNFAGINLTLLNFATATLYVGGDFSGWLNDLGAFTTVIIGGSLTSTGILNAGSIGTMTVGGDLAGLVTVVGLLDTLTVHGGTPGKIIAGDIHVITVFSGYGNKVLQVIEGGVERQIQAKPVAGGTLAGTVHFAFVYDSLTVADPQVAIRITDASPVARTFNLALVVVNSATAKFNLSRVDSYLNGKTGVSNLSLQGDLLQTLTAPELLLFTDSTAASRGGVMLAADSITGVEVSGRLPMGFINVAGIEGLAFGVLTTAAGAPVTVTTPLGSGGIQVLWNLLGSNAAINPATDAFVVPFSETQSVRLFAHVNTSQTLEQVMTLTDQSNDNLSIIAYVVIVPTTNNSINPLVQSVMLAGNGGSINSLLSIANLTSTGPLGDVTISAGAGATVNNAPGLGNISAPSIFGSINVTNAGIYGVIQTTSGDLGRVVLTNGVISSVTTIFANGAITGQIISRGSLISTVKTNGAFTGVIAAQGDIGTIQRDGSGNAVTTAGALTRFGGITIGGADSGQIIALGNLYGNVTVSGTMTGRMAVSGQAVAGLAATRYGILGNVTVSTFALGSAIISGGLAGDLAGGTTLALGTAKGFVAAAGSANLSASTTIAAANLIQNVHSGSNWAAINAIFTNSGASLLFDTGGSLLGLGLIETDLTNIQDAGGILSGTIS